MSMITDFKLTYASMFDPPEELHARFDAALEAVKADALGKTHAMLIGNRDVTAEETFDNRSPINRQWLLGRFQAGTREHANAAVVAARDAFPAWSRTSWQERIRIIRRVCDVIESRLYELGAVTSLNVGKTRMESLADVQEAADLMRVTCDWMERHDGYVFQQASEPLRGFSVRNMSVMKPHGVWLIISPFNFPASLTCAPAGAALAAGNTVVTKPSPETSWIVRWLADCFREGGMPDGVFNYVTGKDDEMGRALVEHPGIDGVTFTGSHAVGMEIYREFAQGPYPRPVVLEMGGKNATIVSRHADLEDAATGIVRAAFGTAGQKCSCTSRVYVEAPVRDALLERIVELTQALRVGDPTRRDVYVGPLISERAYRTFIDTCADLAAHGRILTGGHTLSEGEYAHGFYAEPTVVSDVAYAHRCWRDELFVPLVTIGAVDNLDEAMRMTNDTVYGLTGGFFGSIDEAQWYFDRVEVGTSYANRSQGASTGAWPGYQSFGGWKGSGASGKGTGSPYYIFSYLREQSQTLVTHHPATRRNLR
jgi:1-pyrroline-5-carboxylate dehydrogenase